MGSEVILISNLKEVMGKIDSTARARMQKAVNEVRNTTLETLSGSRHGRIYKVPGTSRTYTASAPGEPPAQRLGELRQSISGAVENDGGNVIGLVGTNRNYGPPLEYGTKKMGARPWLRTSFEKAEGTVKEIFSREWFQ